MISKKAIVAGHICLDMAPDLSSVPNGHFQTLLQPGRLIQTDGVTLSTGGAVPNTGIALQKLGVPTCLIGKVGNDIFGKSIREIINRETPQLADDLVTDLSVGTSFTVILNPPGFDRTFLHYHGANDTFYASDLPRKKLRSADIFHFGYPSLMRSIFRGEGAELVSILQRARRAGLTTSLDFSLPDPTRPGGKVDWPEILANSLPYVDLFLPSVEEMTFLLARDTFDQMCSNKEVPFLEAVTVELLDTLSKRALVLGAKVVLIKIGHRGLYLRTAPPEKWKHVGRGMAGLGDNWHHRTLWAPAFDVNVRGTTGAGDAAIAGFLASILQGTDPETALIIASAAGACSVETTDATSGLMPWEDTFKRIQSNWAQIPLELLTQGWTKDEAHGLWENKSR